MGLFALNLTLALLWMACNGAFSLLDACIGFALGHGVLWLLRPLFHGGRYFRVFWGGLAYCVWLAREIGRSAVRVAKATLGIGPPPCPAILAIPLAAVSDFEIMALACSVTLTPGTLSLDVSEDRSTLYIHAMFAEDPDAVRNEIKNDMERRLLEALR
jgi:multicomponent Na+:H+ antiporter subunit E